MPTEIYKFDTVTLPSAMKVFMVGTGPTANQTLELPTGSVHDGYGSQPAPLRLPYTMIYRAIATGTSGANLLTTFNTLKALQGKRALLYRRDDGGVTDKWCRARLLQIDANREVGFSRHQPLEMTFQVLTAWYGSGHSENTTLNTSPKIVTTTNNGNATVDNAIITVTTDTANMTYFRLDGTGDNGTTSIEFTGTVIASSSLVIDCGARSVTNAGSDAYANFGFTSQHTANGWLYLYSGLNSLTAYRTLGSGNPPVINLGYSDRYA